MRKWVNKLQNDYSDKIEVQYDGHSLRLKKIGDSLQELPELSILLAE